MRRKPKRGQGVDATGRSTGGARHVRFNCWELDAVAFRSLSPPARCLLMELKALYTGMNNGLLFLSVREAAKRVGIGKTKAAEAFRELQECAFIRVSKPGAFSLKTPSRRGDATAWILTEFPIGDAKGTGTKEFMRWTPPATKEGRRRKNYSTVRAGVRAVPLGGHLARNGAELSSHADTLGTKSPSDGPPGGTQLIYHGGTR